MRVSVALLLIGTAGCAAMDDGVPNQSSSATAMPQASAPADATSEASARSQAATNVYARAAAGQGLTGAAARAKPLVYVPNQRGASLDVIDPATGTKVRRFPMAKSPEHVVPSWDLSTLWVNSDEGDTLTPIDPVTGTPGKPVAVADPYNLYFSPDGAAALVMAERLQRIDIRDPHTMRLIRSIPVPCKGVNHADFTADGTALLVSCEFDGRLLVIDGGLTTVRKVIDLNPIATKGATSPHDAHQHAGPKAGLEPGASAMPQDVRLSPDGRTFLVADMLRNGVWMIDAATAQQRGFRHTGLGAHGIYPSRDASTMYVSNRDEGTVSVLDATTLEQQALWRIPHGGSPDMGGVSADGTRLWLSGRFNNEVYVFDTTTGRVIQRIPAGAGPHGLCVWPQPGRYSLGHTGNMR